MSSNSLPKKLKQNTRILYAPSIASWRKWLQKNHLSEQSVWLVFYKKASGKKSLTWREAVDVALCYGWIDSKKVKIDEETSHQFFSKRKAKSTWSKINKDSVRDLIKKGLMTEAGYNSVKIAKQNGSWTILDEVEKLIIPTDLGTKLKTRRGAEEYFLSLSKSKQKSNTPMADTCQTAGDQIETNKRDR